MISDNFETQNHLELLGREIFRNPTTFHCNSCFSSTPKLDVCFFSVSIGTVRDENFFNSTFN